MATFTSTKNTKLKVSTNFLPIQLCDMNDIGGCGQLSNGLLIPQIQLGEEDIWMGVKYSGALTISIRCLRDRRRRDHQSYGMGS